MRERGIGRGLPVLGAALTLAGGACVTTPAQPLAAAPHPETQVFLYPTRGQSPDRQDRDRYECHVWAVRQSGFDPSAPSVPPHLHMTVSSAPPPGTGIAAGLAAGAVLGSILSPPWEAGRGAILGAIAGAALGGVAEASTARQAEEQAAAREEGARAAQLEEHARSYVRALSACLTARGYEVR